MRGDPRETVSKALPATPQRGALARKDVPGRGYRLRSTTAIEATAEKFAETVITDLLEGF